jgi:hypothetical protein
MPTRAEILKRYGLPATDFSKDSIHPVRAEDGLWRVMFASPNNERQLMMPGRAAKLAEELRAIDDLKLASIILMNIDRVRRFQKSDE